MKGFNCALLCVALVSIAMSSAVAQGASTASLNQDALLTSADANGDKAISRSEFVAARARSFDRLDGSGDKTLSRAEFSAAAPAGIGRTFIASQFSGFDTNRDGQLSRAEFNAAPTPGFDRIDNDRNSVLSAEEIFAARARR